MAERYNYNIIFKKYFIIYKKGSIGIICLKLKYKIQNTF